ncbi:MAG: transporter [Deltaproteobacteria bacterium]|nr:transporter [Deltaproteobacteria bacterium]
MGKRSAALVGYTEWAPQRKWESPMFSMEACAALAAEALADVGLEKDVVDGLVIGGLQDSPMFAPLALAEYLGIQTHFGEVVDLGGASSAAMVWRAAAAIEVGMCDTVLVLVHSTPPPVESGADGEKMMLPPYLAGDAWGSPQGQFDIPYGLVAATPSFAMVANRYMKEFGVSSETLAKIAVMERDSGLENPKSVFRGKPIDVEDVLASPMVCDPIHLFEMVMPCWGGGAVVLTTAERAKRLPHRPVFVSGYGEYISHKTVSYMPTLTETPAKPAADQAFGMAGAERSAIDLASFYDCFTITVLLTIEDAGFARKGEGGRFVEEHDLRFSGDWPLNTHGGQLGMGQGGAAGGLSHVIDSLCQLQGRAGRVQLPKADMAYVTGVGGLMASHVGLVLEGA